MIMYAEGAVNNGGTMGGNDCNGMNCRFSIL